MRSARWLAVAVALALPACGRGPPETVPDVAAITEAVDTPVVEATGLRPFLPDAMRRSTRAETFAHDAHAPIACSVCHEEPRGHDAHSGIACAECHRASASATVRSLTSEQCQSCHHAPDQQWTCEHCHETRSDVLSSQPFAFEVWGAPRTRDLPFAHDAHAEIACASCHRTMPALTPAEPCASCHQDHMTAEVRCASCHVAPPPGAHDVDAHLTCAGAGCHNRAPDVEAVADTRSVCLLCHREQEEHEPGGVCVECHRVRPETGDVGR